jgi:hypothetical protein
MESQGRLPWIDPVVLVYNQGLNLMDSWVLRPHLIRLRFRQAYQVCLRDIRVLLGLEYQNHSMHLNRRSAQHRKR